MGTGSNATPGDDPLDWLIVGGGLHGVHAAVRLIADAAVDPTRLRIVDPGPALMHTWRARTSALAMQYLRSPSVHNLGRFPASLQDFAGRKRDRPLGAFAHPFERPALGLFDAHGDALVEEYGLDTRHVRASVTRVEPLETHVRVHTDSGTTLEAARVLLALGPGRIAERPDWAEPLGELADHVMRPGFEWVDGRDSETVVVVGMGMTAVHAALRLASEGAAVELVARHDVRRAQFDTDPGWLGPKYMTHFACLPDPAERRDAIDTARRRGSISPDLKTALGHAVGKGRIRLHKAEVAGTNACAYGADLRLSTGADLHADRVLLCTGFAPGPPAPDLIADLAREAELELSPCGFPLVDSALRWHPRIHVTGALAELRLGPTARNIAGARRAMDSIVAATRPDEASAPDAIPMLRIEDLLPSDRDAWIAS